MLNAIQLMWLVLVGISAWRDVLGQLLAAQNKWFTFTSLVMRQYALPNCLHILI
jgi:hypothetical protein